jgi:ParB-like chromosome segregation protein Spo0J
MRDGDIDGLAESISEVGILQPVVLDNEYRLVAGGRRLAAAKSLKLAAVPCRIIDMDKLHAELAELDENLSRQDYTALERAQALARRKEIYVELHPETKHGGDRKSDGSKNQNDNLSVCFSKEIAEKTGVSERTIERDLEVGEKLDPAAAEAIKDTPVADNRSQLKALADLAPADQRKAAKKIASGKAETVQEATAPKEEKPQKVTDKNGKVVPEHCREVFERASEFDKGLSLCKQLKEIIGKISKDEVIGIHLSAKGIANGALRDVENVRSALKFARPHAVCPYCKGKGCNACFETGWVGMRVYESAPAEKKR